MKILISSRNEDKIKEIKSIIQQDPIELFSALDFPGLPEIDEDADSLLGNALKKAKILTLETGIACVADDTGLFIDALNGNPGVYSARFAGDNCSYKDNRHKVLSEMHNKTDRNARFITVAVLMFPDEEYICAEGCLEGQITNEEIGDKGFGYDPIFWVSSLGTTLAEISLQEKNLISHRSKAFLDLRNKLKEYLA